MLLAHSQSGAITLRAAIQRYFEVALYLLVLTGLISARYAAHLPDSRAVDHRSYRRVRWILFTGLFFHFRRFPERDHTSCNFCAGRAFVLGAA